MKNIGEWYNALPDLTATEVIAMVLMHWFADFLMQDGDWATNKSHDFKKLLKHTVTYSGLWFVPAVLLFFFNTDLAAGNFVVKPLLFVLITFVLHTITDYTSSKVNSKMWSEKRYGSSIPNWGFFTSMGLDQVCHYVQLILTYLSLK